MKRYQLFLAYYTLIATLALFIWSIFFAPKPQGFLLTLFVIPISLYFWLLVSGVSKPYPSDPSSENQNRGEKTKLPLIVLIILFISVFSVFAYSEISSRPLNSESESASAFKQISSLKLELEKQNKAFHEKHEEMVGELRELKDELINIKWVQKVNEDATVMGDATSLVGTVTIKGQENQTVNVYAEKSASSKVLGKAEFGKTYTFIEKDQDWYLILLGNKEGFISSQFVKEVLYEK